MPSPDGAAGERGPRGLAGGLLAPFRALAGRAFGVTTRILEALRRNGMDKDIRRGRTFAARLLRVLVLAVMSFRANQIPVRAGALTDPPLYLSAVMGERPAAGRGSNRGPV